MSSKFWPGDCPRGLRVIRAGLCSPASALSLIIRPSGWNRRMRESGILAISWVARSVVCLDNRRRASSECWASVIPMLRARVSPCLYKASRWDSMTVWRYWSIWTSPM